MCLWVLPRIYWLFCERFGARRRFCGNTSVAPDRWLAPFRSQLRSATNFQRRTSIRVYSQSNGIDFPTIGCKFAVKSNICDEPNGFPTDLPEPLIPHSGRTGFRGRKENATYGGPAYDAYSADVPTDKTRQRVQAFTSLTESGLFAPAPPLQDAAWHEDNSSTARRSTTRHRTKHRKSSSALLKTTH